MATVKLDPAKGVQIPNLTTTERNAISSPETGALIWNTTTSAVNQYNGSAWGTVGISEDTTKLPLAGGTMTGVIAGFTSTGIDDNATSTAVTIDSSENVGIGTASPDVLLDVGDSDHGSAGNTGIQIQNSQAFATVYDGTNVSTFAGIQTVNHDDTSNRTPTGLTFVHRSSGSGIASIQSTSTASDRADLRFVTRGSGGISQKMIISDDGNVGIGVTPESSLSSQTALQVGGTGVITSSTTAAAGADTHYGQNAYLNTSGAWAYQVTDQASVMSQNDGNFRFRVAPSGSADAAITFATPLTITNDGRGLSDFTALCWCSWNMSNSSIKDSHNISSIQDNGVGRQRPIMTNSASDSNYVGVANGNSVANWSGSETTVLGVNTSGPDVYHVEAGTTRDATNVFVICFGG